MGPLDRFGISPPQIFVSYRRIDSGGYAGQLLASLVERYGERAVTLDHRSIEAGADFATSLEAALDTADVVLALIGPDWLTVERDGVRRLDLEGDWVRREIATALARDDVRVIPVLVGGAAPPAPGDLPDDLRDLAGRQMREVRPDRYEDDVAHLIDSIGGTRLRWRGVPLYAWLVAAALVATLAVAALLLTQATPNDPPTVVGPGRIEVVAGQQARIDVMATARDDGEAELTLGVDLRSEQGGIIDDNGDGTVTYTAPVGFSGADTFTYRVIDGGGLEAAASVFIDVLPGALEGAFNVVVPRFAAEGDDAESLARNLSARAFEQTENAVSAVTDLSVATAGPDVVGTVAGAEPRERAASAAELAMQLNANIVLYGQVASADGVSEVVLELFVSERGLTGATELAGSYELGSIEELTSNQAALELALADFLDPRVRAIGELFIGLAHYQLNEHAAAEQRFLAANAAWPAGGAAATNGKEIVLQLLGNVAGLLGRDEDAAARYAEALAIAPGYARARFGLAEVRFQRHRGPDCGGAEPADVAELEGAAAEFAALTTEPAPPLSFLAERSTLELARIELCLTVNGVDRAEDARTRLESLVTAAADNPRLRNVVADTHSSLATYHQIRSEPEAAIASYREAIEATLDDGRRAFFHASIGDILTCFLDSPELANLEYAVSDSLLDEPLPRAACPSD